MSQKEIEVSNHPRPDSTYLQGVSYVKGAPAGNLKPGNTMLWNGGSSSKVHAILKETAAFIWVDEIWLDKGIERHYERKLKKTRIVARPLAELERP